MPESRVAPGQVYCVPACEKVAQLRAARNRVHVKTSRAIRRRLQDQERRTRIQGRQCALCLIRDDEVERWSQNNSYCETCGRNRIRDVARCKRCNTSLRGSTCPECRPLPGLIRIVLIPPNEDGRERIVYRRIYTRDSVLDLLPAPIEVVHVATPEQWRKVR